VQASSQLDSSRARKLQVSVRFCDRLARIDANLAWARVAVQPAIQRNAGHPAKRRPFVLAPPAALACQMSLSTTDIISRRVGNYKFHPFGECGESRAPCELQ
jgi:hypothetical protein